VIGIARSIISEMRYDGGQAERSLFLTGRGNRMLPPSPPRLQRQVPNGYHSQLRQQQAPQLGGYTEMGPGRSADVPRIHQLSDEDDWC